MPRGTLGVRRRKHFVRTFRAPLFQSSALAARQHQFFFIIFIYFFFFFDFARRTSPKSRDYSQSIICVMFGKVNGKSYCKLIVGRASLDVFIKYKNMLLLFLSRYFYARSKTDDFFLYFLLLQAPPQMRKLHPPVPLSTQQEVEMSQRPEEVT